MTSIKDLWRKFKIRYSDPNRRIYVVLSGVYAGEYMVKAHTGSEGSTYFTLPDKEVRHITNEDMEWGLKNNVIDIVDILPKSVYNVCLAEYHTFQTHEPKDNSTDRRK